MSTLDRTTATDDYVTFCEGVRRIAKVDLLQYKRGQMERRIRTFAERQGTTSLPDYLTRLRGDSGELEAFLDRVTINVSQLWRNPEQWTVIAKDLLPELAETGKVRIWSAGSSYGAEAYTLAAVCRDVIPTANTTIVGTDIDERMVERARLGRFTDADARDAPGDALKRHFARVANGWEAKADLKRLVRFETGDLLAMRPRKDAYDLILCRNTVIYFNEDVRDALHTRLAEALRPGGYLVVGSTERIATPSAMGLVSPRPFVYRKS